MQQIYGISESVLLPIFREGLMNKLVDKIRKFSDGDLDVTSHSENYKINSIEFKNDFLDGIVEYRKNLRETPWSKPQEIAVKINCNFKNDDDKFWKLESLVKKTLPGFYSK